MISATKERRKNNFRFLFETPLPYHLREGGGGDIKRKLFLDRP